MISKDDIKARSLIRDKMRRKKRKCWTELLRVYKRRELTRKYSGEEKIRSLQKAMAPPEEFASMTENVRKAKKEIQETNMARTKARRRTKKASKSRFVPVLGFAELDFGISLSLESYFLRFHLSLSSSFFALSNI